MSAENRTPAPKRNRFLPLLAILGVLVVAVLLVVDPFGWMKPSVEELESQDPARVVLVSAAKDDITALEIDPATGDPFTLEKDGEKWVVVQGENRYPADMEKVDNLLKDLPGLRSESLATSDETAYADMEVDAVKAVRLSIYTGDDAPDTVLIVGKSTPGLNSSFIRIGEGKEVYRSERNVKTLVGFDFRDFRTRKPWTFDPALATSLSVLPFTETIALPEDGSAPKTLLPTEPGEMLIFTQEDGLWKSPDGRNGNQNLIKELLKGWSELNISEFADDKKPADVALRGDHPSLSVVTPLGTYSLELGGKDSGSYYLTDQDGYIYKVPEYPLKFYRELEYDKLTFDDTPPEATPEDTDAARAKEEGASSDVHGEETEPNEGTSGDMQSDADEGTK